MDAPRIVIADHSELAKNVYRLLLDPLGAMLVMRGRFEEARPHFFRREGVQLGIFSSNIFGKKFDEILPHFLEDEPLRRVCKIFICRESPSEEGWRAKLAELPASRVVVRPFHPEEFVGIVRKILIKC